MEAGRPRKDLWVFMQENGRLDSLSANRLATTETGTMATAVAAAASVLQRRQ